MNFYFLVFYHLERISALYNNVIHINEERTGKCLRQVEHICGHLRHRYSVTVNRVMVASEKLQLNP
jgi:hypothetical protein